jgi:hypothetical protein
MPEEKKDRELEDIATAHPEIRGPSRACTKFHFLRRDPVHNAGDRDTKSHSFNT